MIPTLFTSTWIAAIAFGLLSVPFLMDRARWEPRVRSFLRSQTAAYITLGIGGAWFLFKITQLKQVDFGDYKMLLFALFGVAWVGSFIWVKDFLAVRGSAVLGLLLCNVGLKSAYALYDIPERLFLVTILYLVIVICLYLGTVPFKLRDFFDWLYAKSTGPKILGSIFAGIAIILAVVSFTY